MHFLVWRESDKSLTLLAKDYEPCEVFAGGLISRGGELFFCAVLMSFLVSLSYYFICLELS
jgi:hypothetical protein